MRVRRDSLRIHRPAGVHAQLPLPGLPAGERRPFSSLVVVPVESFRITQGLPRFHASPSEMGGMTRRGFCAECGTPVLGKPDAAPHIVAIRTASLDDPGWFRLQAEVWTSDANAWDELNPTVPQFEKYPA